MFVHSFITLLATLLAVLMGTGSFGLYMVAFFFPEIYRQHDLTWSGVAMVYAIALGLSADHISLPLLIGQIAVVTLLGRFVWQNLEQRRAIAPNTEKTAFLGEGDSMAMVLWVKGRSLMQYLFNWVKQRVQSGDAMD